MHNQLIIKLNEKSKEAVVDPAKKDGLDGFLVNWLIKHILSQDADIGDFVCE